MTLTMGFRAKPLLSHYYVIRGRRGQHLTVDNRFVYPEMIILIFHRCMLYVSVRRIGRVDLNLELFYPQTVNNIYSKF